MSNILKRLATATIGLHLKSLIFVNISILTLKIIDLLSWHNRYITVKSYFGKTLLMSWASWARLMNPEGKSTCGEKKHILSQDRKHISCLLKWYLDFENDTLKLFHIWTISYSENLDFWNEIGFRILCEFFSSFFKKCLHIAWFHSRHVTRNLCKLPSLVCHSLRLWARLPHLHLGKWWLP